MENYALILKKRGVRGFRSKAKSFFFSPPRARKATPRRTPSRPGRATHEPGPRRRRRGRAGHGASGLSTAPAPARTALADAAGAEHHQLVLAGLPRGAAARAGSTVHLLSAQEASAPEEEKRA